MTFTSAVFFVGLLPWLVILAFITRKKQTLKMILLILANTVFYIWGGVAAFIFICVFSILMWSLSKIVLRFPNRTVLSVSIIIAIFPLLTVKYMSFFFDAINEMAGCHLSAPKLLVPMGISFFTFEAVSMICDMYRTRGGGKVTVLDVYCYLTFFPTVTSGPIIRYQNFYEGLKGDVDSQDYAKAIERIIIGLGKKLLIADKIGILADYFFDGVANGSTYSVAGMWIGSIAYTLQLYYDFSGYSDIAIGIGKLLGFHINENFNYPYQASSISDFWKRWHISLSQWFRDYVYIPLGGNRCSVLRHIINLFIVWLLTGIWHGADWSFVVWGMGYFVLLLLEKYSNF